MSSHPFSPKQRRQLNSTGAKLSEFEPQELETSFHPAIEWISLSLQSAEPIANEIGSAVRTYCDLQRQCEAHEKDHKKHKAFAHLRLAMHTRLRAVNSFLLDMKESRKRCSRQEAQAVSLLENGVAKMQRVLRAGWNTRLGMISDMAEPVRNASLKKKTEIIGSSESGAKSHPRRSPSTPSDALSRSPAPQSPPHGEQEGDKLVTNGVYHVMAENGKLLAAAPNGQLCLAPSQGHDTRWRLLFSRPGICALTHVPTRGTLVSTQSGQVKLDGFLPAELSHDEYSGMFALESWLLQDAPVSARLCLPYYTTWKFSALWQLHGNRRVITSQSTARNLGTAPDGSIHSSRSQVCVPQYN